MEKSSLDKRKMQPILALLYNLIFGSVYFIFVVIGRVVKSETLMDTIVKISEEMCHRMASASDPRNGQLDDLDADDRVLLGDSSIRPKLDQQTIKLLYGEEMGHALDMIRQGFAGICFNVITLVHLCTVWIKKKVQH